MPIENGFDEITLIDINGNIFGVKVINHWKDGKCIERKDFTKEIWQILDQHHAKTVKERLNSITEGGN